MLLKKIYSTTSKIIHFENKLKVKIQYQYTIWDGQSINELQTYYSWEHCLYNLFSVTDIFTFYAISIAAYLVAYTLLLIVSEDNWVYHQSKHYDEQH